MPGSILLVSIGNTRTRLARASAGQLEPSRVLDNADTDGLLSAVAAAVDQSDSVEAVWLATVNPPMADRVEAPLRDALGSGDVPITRFGRDIQVPIQLALEDESTVGQDRLLDALGAFSRSRQACVVIDAGTAVTVDFVDGHGTFQGGAIAPGLHMMLRSLHRDTAALPEVALSSDLLRRNGLVSVSHPPEEFAGKPGDGMRSAPSDDELGLAEASQLRSPPPFGKNTPQAIAVGVVGAVRGLVHHLVETYSTFFGAYPRIIATGGDAPLLFANDPIVEQVVPDLTLIGMLAAAQILDDEEADVDLGEER